MRWGARWGSSWGVSWGVRKSTEREYESYLSNVFHFTFGLNLHLEPLNKEIKDVLPLNTHEAEKYITGRNMVQDNLSSYNK